MKAIVLAAGRGTRLNLPGQNKNLLLLPLDGGVLPLIVYTIQRLQEHNIHDISVVTGYLHEHVEAALAGYRVKCYYNPFYYLVNSLASLWFARDEINDDTLLLNADTFLEPRLYSTLLESKIPEYPLLLVDTSKKDDADVKVRFADGFLSDYGKDMNAPSAESTDIVILPKQHTEYFKNQLDKLIEEKKHDTWWESALVNNTGLVPVKIQDIAGYFWSEVDYYRDYENICDFIKKTPKT